MLNVIWQWKYRWIGYVLTHNEFLQEITEGRMTEKPTRERRQIQLLNNVVGKKDYASLKRSLGEIDVACNK